MNQKHGTDATSNKQPGKTQGVNDKDSAQKDRAQKTDKMGADKGSTGKSGSNQSSNRS